MPSAGAMAGMPAGMRRGGMECRAFVVCVTLLAVSSLATVSAWKAPERADRLIASFDLWRQLGATPSVRPFQVFEGALKATASPSDPFSTLCGVSVVGPSGSRRHSMNVSAFFVGDATWTFRFNPDATGVWHWEARCPALAGVDGSSGSVNCSGDAMGSGGVVADPSNSRRLITEDGQPFLMVGYEVDWLWSLALVEGMDVVDSFVATAAQHGFNHFLLSFYANFSSWNSHLPDLTPPKVSPSKTTPWTNNSPWASGARQLDLDYYENWDSVLGVLAKYGVTAHMMLSVGNKNVNWPAKMSLEDNRFWAYTLARYDAFPNIIWDISKEAGSYGMGRPYELARLEQIGNMNAHQHLVTAHSGVMWSNECSNLPWVTLCSFQIHHSDHSDDFWYDAILSYRQQNENTPLLDAEFMYEAGKVRLCNGSAAHDCVSTPEDIATARKVMYDQYMAGAYAAWYNCDTAWDVIVTDTVSAGYGYVHHLSSFFGAANTSYNALQPRSGIAHLQQANSTFIHAMVDASCHTFVVHVRDSEAFTLDSSCGKGIHTAEWFDPVTGTRVTAPLDPLAAATAHTFTPPDSFSDDAVLLALG